MPVPDGVALPAAPEGVVSGVDGVDGVTGIGLAGRVESMFEGLEPVPPAALLPGIADCELAQSPVVRHVPVTRSKHSGLRCVLLES